MDPCPFVRILIGNLAIKFPAVSATTTSSSSSSSSYFCKIKLDNLPHQQATIPLVDRDFQDPEPSSVSQSIGGCFNLNKSQLDRILHNNKKTNPPSIKIEVYKESSSSCSSTSNNGKLLGIFQVKLDLRGAENKPCEIFSGWIPIKKNKSELFVSIKSEPDPRFVFKFGGEPETSPQVFQIQGGSQQAVFTCNFSCRNSSDRNNLCSRPSISESSKDQFSKERKGWSITVHDLSGYPVAMASMVTPFVPSPGSDRVSKSNPGAWLILRPSQATWKPWGRLEAWRRDRSTVGYRFHDTSSTTIVDSFLSKKSGGKFSIDITNNVTNITPFTSPQSSCDFGSWTDTGSRPSSRPGSGSGSDFGFGLHPYKGFVMSSTVEGVAKCSKPEVEVGVKHVSCTEDAAAFVALAAAMDLSMDACLSFSHKLRKELRHTANES
ncbi:uncharacterized protein [Rutidosis leptorrhynchoides]|uniref:uncharacterized protein n=1 Tax=Rutidosis leptorrhynchoides TaxID=125765 RepID=UPI003A99EC9E